MFGGFWGTHREAAWRRRKDREHGREERIRSEEEGALIRLRARHDLEIEEREQILDIATGLINDARYDAGAVRRRRDRDDSERGAEGGESDPRGQNGGRKRRRTDLEPVPVKSEEDAGNNSNSQGPNIDVANDEMEPDAEESVHENLLALSYAMFDTLYATRSFDARAFSSFLQRQGEHSLAEQIAIAAVEKSGGDEKSVSFVLKEIVPGSDEPDVLVKAVEELLQSSRRSDGTEFLMGWKMEQGDTEGAFNAALLLSDEYEMLNMALPLATTEQRRLQLKASCKMLLHPDITRKFDDAEWTAFLTSLLPIKKRHKDSYFQFWQPTYDQYVEYAASSMVLSRGVQIATGVLKEEVSKALTDAFSKSGIGDEDRIPYNKWRPVRIGEYAAKLIAEGNRTCDQMKKTVSELRAELSAVKASSNKLGLDQDSLIAEQMKATLGLPPENKCQTRHKAWESCYNCSKCRDAAVDLARNLGAIRALRQHPDTSQSAPFLRIGLTCSPTELAGVLAPGRAESMVKVTDFLLKDDMNMRCQYLAS
mmetsp:Transcript_20174/g.58351  ORF Transcript_20174/g.58351 Transcript_20174/m.58351 type:complete len:537 (-) Transcript_20174:107-1717(-)